MVVVNEDMFRYYGLCLSHFSLSLIHHQKLSADSNHSDLYPTFMGTWGGPRKNVCFHNFLPGWDLLIPIIII